MSQPEPPEQPQEDDAASEPTRCYRWPHKKLYKTADEASVALRRVSLSIERERRKIARRRGSLDGEEIKPVTLTVYPCLDHFHHGSLPIREGTVLHPSERRPPRAVRAKRQRPRRPPSPGLNTRGS